MKLIMHDDELLAQAQEVLQKNWVDLDEEKGFTKPSNKVYPFQWNWDSAFFAYGYAHYDIDKAIKELRALFSGQWKDGMVPHIIFHEFERQDNQQYFPGPEVWNVHHENPDAPDDVLTSGITQPPLHAMAVWHLYKELAETNKEQAQQLLDEFYPKLMAMHRFFVRERDPEKWGLLTIVHPWESGLDNSPRWDEALKRIEPAEMSMLDRRDTQHVEKTARPSDDEYRRYIALLNILKDHHYDEKAYYADFPFKIKDIVLSSIFYMANKRLKKMATLLEKDGDNEEIDTWMQRFEQSLLEKCWNDEEKLFFDIDLINAKQIQVDTVAALMPMITGILEQRHINGIRTLIDSTDFCGEQACAVKLVPSTSISSAFYNEQLYWRGPIWINMNWFLWKGFLECDMKDVAKDIRDAMVELVRNEGFWEYFSPKTGKGIGAKDFSWTAALIIDLLHEN